MPDARAGVLPIVGVVVAAAAAVAAATAVGVGAFLVAAYARRKHFDARAGASTALVRWDAALLLREAGAFARVVAWSVGRRRRRPLGPNARCVVVLVHGMGADGTCTTAWGDALAARGYDVVAPDHGVWLWPLEVHASRLARAVLALEGSDGLPRLHFVCHSMGGIVLRAVLAEYGAIAAATASVTTVATPHRGSAGGRGIPWSRVQRLTTGSALFAQLPMLRMLVPHARRATIGSLDDAIVYPPTTTHDPEDAAAERHDVEGIGHATLLVAPRIAQAIVHIVARADGHDTADEDDGAAGTSC